MALVLSRTAFRRLCLLPLLLLLFIFFFYRQIANIYRHVEYTGNITAVQAAFHLFNRRPTDVCLNVELLNVGQPENDDLSAYPQLMCTDPGYEIDRNDCLVHVIKSQQDEWSLEEIMEQMGCRVHSSLLASSSISSYSTERVSTASEQNRTARERFHVDWLSDEEAAGQAVQRSYDVNESSIDYMLIRIGSGDNEWKILSNLAASKQLSRVKQLSVGVNLCPDRSEFTQSHFQFVLDVDRQLVAQWDMKLFHVANDQGTYVYNPIVKEKTYCAAQFAWINQRFRKIVSPSYLSSSSAVLENALARN